MRSDSVNPERPGEFDTGGDMSVANLLRLTALFEGATGVALLALPALMLWALFGQADDAAFPILLARLFGAPLLSLSFVCWTASRETSSHTILSHVAAMLLYNLVVAALLVYAGQCWDWRASHSGPQSSRISFWPAGAWPDLRGSAGVW